MGCLHLVISTNKTVYGYESKYRTVPAVTRLCCIRSNGDSMKHYRMGVCWT